MSIDAAPLPQSLGPYRIVRKLGHGGMGVVYEAVHESISRRVAIKLLHSEYAHNLERNLKNRMISMISVGVRNVVHADQNRLRGAPTHGWWTTKGPPRSAIGGEIIRKTKKGVARGSEDSESEDRAGVIGRSQVGHR
jgi:serine/threonine protein kinase